MKPHAPRSSKLPENLKKQLETITPSMDRELNYYPCIVQLRDGTKTDHVYFVSENLFKTYWGIWPSEDNGKHEIRLEDVLSLAESPSRLPAQFANKIYEKGESGMGYTVFSVLFTDGSRQAFVTGNAVDFIEYPKGKNGNDVADVSPHQGREANPTKGPKYYWCLYSE